MKDAAPWIAIGLTAALAVGSSLIGYGANKADIERLKADQHVTQDMRARQERIDERTLNTQKKVDEIGAQNQQILNLLLQLDAR